MLNTSDYYPFGLQMEGRSTSLDGEYRYGFNGKEKDPEGMGGGGSTYDYGFRIYNPRIAKFLSVDPLTKSYPMLTPYQFASNRPIDGIDLDGLEFYKATYFDLDLVPVFSIINQTTVQQLTIKPDILRMKNGGVLDAIRNKSKQGDKKTIIDGIDKSTDLALEFKDLGISSGSNLGRVLIGLSRTSSAIGIIGEFVNAYDRGKKQGEEVGFVIAINILDRDIQRAEWVSEVVAYAVNSGIVNGDFNYIKQLANFALDGQIPVVNVSPITGLGMVDEDLLNRLKSDFEKIANIVEEDNNLFTEISNNDLDRGQSTKYVKIRERKFKDQPK